MIIGLIQAYRYNSLVIAFTKRLVFDYFKEDRFLIEKSAVDYLESRDSIRYTEFFRKRKISVEIAAIHYFDFGITQLKRVLLMSHQQDIADLVTEMECGLDQIQKNYLDKLMTDNGSVSEALSSFISGIGELTPTQAEES